MQKLCFSFWEYFDLWLDNEMIRARLRKEFTVGRVKLLTDAFYEKERNMLTRFSTSLYAAMISYYHM